MVKRGTIVSSIDIKSMCRSLPCPLQGSFWSLAIGGASLYFLQWAQSLTQCNVVSHAWPPKMLLHERERVALALMGGLMVTTIKGHASMGLRYDKLKHILASLAQMSFVIGEVILHYQAISHLYISFDRLLVKQSLQSFLELLPRWLQVLNYCIENRVLFVSLFPISDVYSSEPDGVCGESLFYMSLGWGKVITSLGSLLDGGASIIEYSFYSKYWNLGHVLGKGQSCLPDILWQI